MASKFGLAGGIPERRVRPIWDAVDSRQYKNALKLAVGLLAKYSNSLYALALKALILERMGKPDEALSICLNAKELLFSNTVVHIDDLTLSTLQIVFQRLDRLDLATSCYEHASGRFPTNLEIMMGLFNCYVREYSYVKQQQTAIKMYKIVGEERFLLWAVCSIQLQVCSSSDGDKLLPLAEALLKKHIASHSLHEPEALLIYISILEQQAKYETALEIISGNLGSLIGIEVDKLHMQGRLLARACDYAAAAEIFQRILELCPDDWEAFLHYVDCLLEIDVNWSRTSTVGHAQSLDSVDLHSCKSTDLSEEVFNSRISSALSFVQKLQMEVESDLVRCPYLANIEIERQWRLNGKADDGKLVEAILNYFRRFGHLSCFASDLEVCSSILTSDEKKDLSRKVMEISEFPLATPLRTLGRSITMFKLQELFGVSHNVPDGEAEGISRRMVDMYCKNLPLSRDLDPQENMHGEELLSMASNVLVKLFWRTRQLGFLLEAIMVLEFGLIIRRHVWQYKVLLLHLYSHLGGLPLAYDWYGTLEIKNILLETVSHHILPQMLRSPCLLETADLLKEYLKFMDDHLREAADLTFLAYRHRSYSKVIEFVQFKERLQHSHQYLAIRLEASILQLKMKANSLEDTECFLENSSYGIQLLELSDKEKLELITFNEDLQTRPWWSPTSDVNYLSEPFQGGLPCLNKNLYNHRAGEKEDLARKSIERKSFLPRLVHLSIESSSSSLKENLEANGSTPVSSSTLKCLLERYARNTGHSFDEAVEMIIGISEGQKCFKECGLDVVYWINFAVFYNALNISSRQEVLSGDTWHIVDKLVQKSIAEQLAQAQPILTSPGSNCPILVQLVTESFSWHILVIQSCLRSLLPSGKKKKKGSAADQSNLPQLQVIRKSIDSLSNAIRDVQLRVLDQINRSEDESLDILLSHLHRREDKEGPGELLQILEEHALSSNAELGDRISGALQSWSAATVMRKLVSAQCKYLSRLEVICNSKLKLLESLRQSI